MPSTAVVAIDVIAAVVIAWLFNLVRRDRLHVGYGVILVAVILAGGFVLSVPPVLRAVNTLGGIITAAPGLILLTLAFLVLMVVYLLTQVTLLANRLTRLVQELAIRNASAAPTNVSATNVGDAGPSNKFV
jgi:hypothetical protein